MANIIIQHGVFASALENHIERAVKTYLSDEELKKEFVASILSVNSEHLFTQHRGFQSDIQGIVQKRLIEEIIKDERFEEVKTAIFERLKTAEMNDLLMLTVMKLFSQTTQTTSERR